MNTRQNALTRYMTTPTDLQNWIGLEQFFNQLTPVNQNPTYPPYNIERINEDNYRVVIALAGFTADRLNVELKDGELVVKDIPQLTENEAVDYLHKGIANRSFTLKFHLSPEIIVDNSNFVDGLLTINMHREVPESKRPRLIKIN